MLISGIPRHSPPDMPTQTSLDVRWTAASRLTEEERTALFLNEPHLEDAMRRLSRNMLALAAGDRAIDGIVKDAGRFFAAGMAMTLHATGGLTLPRLKQFCIDSGLISPGRARALLLYLRFLRYVEPVPGIKRGGAYVPTASMRDAWGAITRAGDRTWKRRSGRRQNWTRGKPCAGPPDYLTPGGTAAWP